MVNKVWKSQGKEKNVRGCSSSRPGGKRRREDESDPHHIHLGEMKETGG